MQSNNRWEGVANGLGVRVARAAEIVRPRRLIGRFWAAPELHR
jgi:hypothetical protein